MDGFELRAHTILLTMGGSRVYGLHRPESDVDLKGVAIPPARHFHGLLHEFEQTEDVVTFRDLLDDDERAAAGRTRLEGVVFEIRKFLRLAGECNPNILDVLFCRDAEVRLLTPLGRRLRDARHSFVSAQARHTFSGYASAQLKRIRGHRQWLLDPPRRPPTRAEYGLPENTLLPKDQLAAAEAAVRKQIERWNLDFSGIPAPAVVAIQNAVAEHLAEMRVALGFETTDDMSWLAAARKVGLDSNLIYVMQKEREYDAAARHYRQYAHWQASRNPARAALEAEHGYDTKHAAHLIRLLRMGREILETGRVHVWRGEGGAGDAAELQAIRAGAWTYEQLVEVAEREDAALKRVYAEQSYVVPREPDRAAIDRLCVELVEESICPR